jgi:hypothetical protein
MDELVRWLGEQLDEDERIARGTGQPGTSWRNFEMDGELRDDVNAGTVAYIPVEETRAHISEWDPARVLREIDAKRQLLADYTVTARIRDEAAVRIKAAGNQPDAKDLETWDRAQREVAILEGPVKLAASPLADRPGYREDWRP